MPVMRRPRSTAPDSAASHVRQHPGPAWKAKVLTMAVCMTTALEKSTGKARPPADKSKHSRFLQLHAFAAFTSTPYANKGDAMKKSMQHITLVCDCTPSGISPSTTWGGPPPPSLRLSTRLREQPAGWHAVVMLQTTSAASSVGGLQSVANSCMGSPVPGSKDPAADNAGLLATLAATFFHLQVICYRAALNVKLSVDSSS